MRDIDIAKRLVRTEQSAISRGKDFELSFKRLKVLMNTKTCYITGIPVQTEDEKADDYLTLERLDNSKGYMDDNVVACASFMNKLKGELSTEQIVLMYKALKKKKLI